MTKVAAILMSLSCSVCSFTPSAGADPISVRSGSLRGTAALPEQANAQDLILSAGGFEINSPLEDEIAVIQLASALPPLLSGALADWSGVLRVNDTIGARLGEASLLLNGPFEMSFHATPTPIACRNEERVRTCVATAPFKFDAELTFTSLSGGAFTKQFIGAGTVDGTLARIESTSSEVVHVEYNLRSNVTPEPATIWFVASGTIVLGGGVWSRRRERSSTV